MEHGSTSVTDSAPPRPSCAHDAHINDGSPAGPRRRSATLCDPPPPGRHGTGGPQAGTGRPAQALPPHRSNSAAGVSCVLSAWPACRKQQRLGASGATETQATSGKPRRSRPKGKSLVTSLLCPRWRPPWGAPPPHAATAPPRPTKPHAPTSTPRYGGGGVRVQADRKHTGRTGTQLTTIPPTAPASTAPHTIVPLLQHPLCLTPLP